MQNTKELTIGKFAQASGVGVETVRFYERKGMIKQPSSSGGFRRYPSSDILKVKFIKRAQGLGFTLKEIKSLLDLRVRSKLKCGEVSKKSTRKLQEIEKKIKDLQKIKKGLTEIVRCCDVGKISDQECPIVECFGNVSERKGKTK